MADLLCRGRATASLPGRRTALRSLVGGRTGLVIALTRGAGRRGAAAQKKKVLARSPRATENGAAGRPRAEGPLRRAGALAWQFIGVALAVLLAGWAAGRLMPVLLPLGIALLLTALVRPVAARLERDGLPTAAAAGVTVGGVVAVVAGLVAVIVPPVVSRAGALGNSIAEGARRVADSFGQDALGMSPQAVDRALDDVLERVRSHLGALAGDAISGATAIAGALGTAVLVLFLSFFLVKDGEHVWRWLVALLPEQRREPAGDLGARVWTVLTVYSRGVVFVATVDAVLIGLALVIVGVPLALELAVLTWVAAFFPIVGAIVAGAAAVLVALVAQGLTSALVVLAAIVTVQQLEGNVLYPVVVGPRLKLHPIVVLLAVVAGGTIAGLAGAFLAVPMATACAAALEFGQEQRR
ncbi:MAG TPA: AI-2E family transporter [Solirubrobacteraceae bacterium]|nr:AI-2E family transporter [Solirubrobacteraceae bacterium]